MNEGYVNLGCANGWKEDPQIVKDCKHGYPQKKDKGDTFCWHEVVCHECKYTYSYDSSG